MRILLVGPSPDVPGGIGSWMRLLQENPPEGIEFVPAYTLTTDTAMSDYRTRFGPPPLRLAKNALHMARLLRRLPRLIQESDVVGAHIHFASRGSFLRKRLVAKKLLEIGLPYGLHAHGAEFHMFYENSSQKTKMQIVEFLNNSRGLICLATFWKEFYQHLLKDAHTKQFVLVNPVELPDLIPQREVRLSMRLVFLGRMGDRKGSARAVRAVAMLPDTVRPHVELWLAGDGEVEATRVLVHELGLEQQVRVSGWIDAEERNRWLKDADAFILPTRAEGVPMSILEAIAWGLPVITTPVGGIPDVIRSGVEGIMVEPDDIQAISEAMRFFVEHPEERLRMGQNARQRAREFALPEYRRKLRDIYLELFG